MSTIAATNLKNPSSGTNNIVLNTDGTVTFGSTLAATNLKNASSASNNIVLNTDGTTTIAAPSNIIKSGTAVASTSGTAIDFTSIPSWVKRVTVMFDGVSTNGSSQLAVQLGTSAGFVATGYNSYASASNSAGGSAESTTNFVLEGSLSLSTSTVRFGAIQIMNISGNNWVMTGALSNSGYKFSYSSSGSVPLSGALTQVRVTTLAANTFDAGTINILYEG